MKPQQPHIRVIRGPAALDVLTSFCKEHLDPLGDSELSLSVQLVLEELFTNVMRHGYLDQEGTVEVGLDIESALVTLTIRDRSPAFDPFKQDTSIIRLDEGQRGLALVRQLAETTNYERSRDEENIVQCTFSRSPR